MRIALTEICRPKQWKTIPASQLQADGFPVFGANGVIGFFSEYNHENPTILITCRGASCGEINVCLPYSYVTGNAMCLDNLSGDYDLGFVAHYLRSYDFSRIISGSAQPQITKQDLSKVQVPILPIDQQIEYRNIFDEILSMRALANDFLCSLDRLIVSRFIEMFGDPLTNSRGLPTKPFIDVVTMQRGHDLPVQHRVSTGLIPVYGANGVVGYHDVAKRIEPCVITGRSGTMGEVFCVKGPCWPLNTSLYSVDTHGNNVVYLKYLLTLFRLERFTAGSGVPTLNRNLFHQEPIIDVSPSQQLEFASFVQQVDILKVETQQAADKLQMLYDSLAQEYFGS